MACTGLTAETIANWVAEEPFPPYSYYRDIPTARCWAYRAAQLQQLAAAASHHAVHEETPSGEVLVGISELPWDSEQLGMPAGRLDYAIVRRREPAGERHDSAASSMLALYEVAAAAAVRTAASLGLRHLSARLDSRELPLAQALESAGFRLVDALLRLGVDATRLEPAAVPAGVELAPAVEDDLPGLVALAARGFVHDRFHNDPALGPGAADRLHASWVENAVRGRTGDGVLVARVGGRPAGFFIVALDRLTTAHLGTTVGSLVLITVDRELRHRGIALALSLGAARWLVDLGAQRLEVGTQLANVPATNLYTKAGFRLLQSSVSLRWAS